MPGLSRAAPQRRQSRRTTRAAFRIRLPGPARRARGFRDRAGADAALGDARDADQRAGRELGRHRRARRGQEAAAGDCRASAAQPAAPGGEPASRRMSARCSTGRRAPARRCSPRRSPTNAASTSSPSTGRSCSPNGSANPRRACATSSASPARWRRPSSSSTSSIRSRRCAASTSGSMTTDRVVNQLLAELDGVEQLVARHRRRARPTAST